MHIILPTISKYMGCVLCVVLIIASVFDIKAGRIPNLLTFPFMGIGLILTHIFMSQFILIQVIGMLAIFLLGILKIMGMGDIKLLMVITAFIHPIYLLYVLLISSTLFVAVYIGTIKKPNIHKGHAFAPYISIGTFISMGGAMLCGKIV